MSQDIKVYLSSKPDLKKNIKDIVYIDTFPIRNTVEGEYNTLYSILDHAQYIIKEDQDNDIIVWKSFIMNRDSFESDIITRSNLKDSIIESQIYQNNKDLKYLVFQVF